MSELKEMLGLLLEDFNNELHKGLLLFENYHYDGEDNTLSIFFPRFGLKKAIGIKLPPDKRFAIYYDTETKKCVGMTIDKFFGGVQKDYKCEKHENYGEKIFIREVLPGIIENFKEQCNAITP